MTAGPRSRQAGLRRCDRGNPLAKRVCGLACKQFSSFDQDRAKHVGQGGQMAVGGRKDQRGSHTRPSFDRLGIRLLSTAPFGVRSSRLPAGPPKRGQENEPCRNVPTNRTTPAANEPTVSVPAWRRRTAEKFWPTVAVKVASASRSAAAPSSFTCDSCGILWLDEAARTSSLAAVAPATGVSSRPASGPKAPHPSLPRVCGAPSEEGPAAPQCGVDGCCASRAGRGFGSHAARGHAANRAASVATHAAGGHRNPEGRPRSSTQPHQAPGARGVSPRAGSSSPGLRHGVGRKTKCAELHARRVAQRLRDPGP